MDFSVPRRRSRIDSIVPMINIVFLLLVFFLLTATVAPPEPLEVTPPESEAGQQAEGEDILFLAADGTLALGAAEGEAVFEAIAARPAEAPPLMLRADRAVPGAEIAALMARLGEIGVERVRLVVGQP